MARDKVTLRAYIDEAGIVSTTAHVNVVSGMLEHGTDEALRIANEQISKAVEALNETTCKIEKGTYAKGLLISYYVNKDERENCELIHMSLSTTDYYNAIDCHIHNGHGMYMPAPDAKVAFCENKAVSMIIRDFNGDGEYDFAELSFPITDNLMFDRLWVRDFPLSLIKGLLIFQKIETLSKGNNL